MPVCSDCPWSRAGRSATRCGSWPGTGPGYDAAVARLREHGYEPHEEMFDGDQRGRAAYVTDPDGNVVEFWTWDVANHLNR